MRDLEISIALEYSTPPSYALPGSDGVNAKLGFVAITLHYH